MRFKALWNKEREMIMFWDGLDGVIGDKSLKVVRSLEWAFGVFVSAVKFKFDLKNENLQNF